MCVCIYICVYIYVCICMYKYIFMVCLCFKKRPGASEVLFNYAIQPEITPFLTPKQPIFNIYSTVIQHWKLVEMETISTKIQRWFNVEMDSWNNVGISTLFGVYISIGQFNVVSAPNFNLKPTLFFGCVSGGYIYIYIYI